MRGVYGGHQLFISVLRHLLVKVVHRPKEELRQLARQVAQAPNRRLVQRSTRLDVGETISQKLFQHHYIEYSTRTSKIWTPGSARLGGSRRMVMVIARKSRLGIPMLASSKLCGSKENSPPSHLSRILPHSHPIMRHEYNCYPPHTQQ